MAGGHGGDHAGAIKLYLGIFVALTVLTVVEMIPLFGIADLPASVLIGLSVVKFVVVCYFFMHLLGDHPIFQRLFFIPLLMVILTVAVLMTLAGSWSLNYRKASVLDRATVEAMTPEQRGEACLARAGVKDCCPEAAAPAEGAAASGGAHPFDAATCQLLARHDQAAIAARYRGVWQGDCNAWAKSAITGNEYCASPGLVVDVAPAYAAVKEAASAKDPRFDGFDAKTDADKLAVLMGVGKEVYDANCAACHQAEGQGLAGVFPPLANDPVANGGKADEHINVVLKGLSGKVINGVTYAAAMAPWAQLSNEQIASVVTYERQSWGNKGEAVMPTQVAALR
jgi:mono/diheme cytochrome c family protein/cytochrome c oxidase subunit IV